MSFCGTKKPSGLIKRPYAIAFSAKNFAVAVTYAAIGHEGQLAHTTDPSGAFVEEVAELLATDEIDKAPLTITTLATNRHSNNYLMKDSSQQAEEDQPQRNMDCTPFI